MLFKSVKAIAGICNFTALAIISLILSSPLEMLYSEDTLKWTKEEFMIKQRLPEKKAYERSYNLRAEELQDAGAYHSLYCWRIHKLEIFYQALS